MKFEFKLEFNALNFLIGLNVIIFILAFIIQITLGFDSRVFFLFGGEITSKILSGDWWLSVTSAFFHMNILHFLLNVYALFTIGNTVKNYYGGKKLFITYILTAITASLLSFVVSVFLGNEIYSLGASGAIFGLMGLLTAGSLRVYRYGTSLPFSVGDVLPYALLSFFIGFTPGLNVNNVAHLGGFIGGFILGFIIKHSIGSLESKTERNLIDALFYLCCAILGIAYIFLLFNGYNLIFNVQS